MLLIISSQVQYKPIIQHLDQMTNNIVFNIAHLNIDYKYQDT